MSKYSDIYNSHRPLDLTSMSSSYIRIACDDGTQRLSARNVLEMYRNQDYIESEYTTVVLSDEHQDVEVYEDKLFYSLSQEEKLSFCVLINGHQTLIIKNNAYCYIERWSSWVIMPTHYLTDVDYTPNPVVVFGPDETELLVLSTGEIFKSIEEYKHKTGRLRPD